MRLARAVQILLAAIVVASLALLILISPHVVGLLELEHEVPNPWTPFDLALIGLPVSIMVVAIAATITLMRRKFALLWVGFGLLGLDCLIIAMIIKTGLGD